MEKRRVTITIGGQKCSFYTDDPAEHISALEKRANEALGQTAKFSGSSISMNAILAIISLTDALIRAEKGRVETSHEAHDVKRGKKAPPKAESNEKGQVSVWDLLDKPS